MEKSTTEINQELSYLNLLHSLTLFLAIMCKFKSQMLGKTFQNVEMEHFLA